MNLPSRRAIKRTSLIGLLVIQGALSATASGFAEERVWPESNIKIDPEDVGRQVMEKLNTIGRGMFFLTPAPPAGFPVPIPPDASNTTYTTKGPVVAGSMKTKDLPASLIKWYKQAIAQRGFNVTEHAKCTAEDSGRCGIITATKCDTNSNTTTNLTITVIQPATSYSMLSITSITLPTPKPTAR